MLYAAMVKVTFNAVSVVTWSVSATNVCSVVSTSLSFIEKIPQLLNDEETSGSAQSSATVNVTAATGFVFNLR